MAAAERIEFPSQALQSGGRRVLPNSQEAEESVVGGVLLYPKAFLQCADLVSMEDFYDPIKKILSITIKAVETRYDRKQAITGVPSGYHKLDAMTAGFQPSELVIIAARPSMGKTSLVMNAVQNAAIEFGVPALVFSLEMSKESL